MNIECDLVIVGAGIVGVSTAMWASAVFPGLSILILEKERQIATHQSSHNSGVIHTGIYYKPGSDKAKLCVRGAAALLEFCHEHGIQNEICGKTVVASSKEQMPALSELYSRGVQNGVLGLELIGRDELRELEPHAIGVAALRVPGAGITDYSEVTRKYAEIAVGNGVQLLTGAELLSIASSAQDIVLETAAGSVHSKFLINCAGLYSDRVAKMSGAQLNLKIVPFRGEYYELVAARRHLVRNLIYPVADPRFPFLGVHFTRHVNGGVEAGPNAVLALKREGYRWLDFNLQDVAEISCFPGFWRMAGRYWKNGLQEVHRSLSKRSFVRGLQRLVPEVREQDLVVAGSGVRAQAVGTNGKLLDDFHFVQRDKMLHVCNVPSPAATASLMIGRKIIRMAAQQFQSNLPPQSRPSNTFLSRWWASSELH
jgi:(S)-2-hydroxyglutarate dehydrogenase